MKTIYESQVRRELISRIEKLNEQSVAQWGKMNVYQMAKHCALWEEMMLGRRQYKRVFIGRIFGKVALKNLLKDESPLPKNTPTIPELKITGTGNVPAEKDKWISLIGEYANFPNTDVVHPFFGKMTRDQIGHLAYKHTDHHLRQFNS